MGEPIRKQCSHPKGKEFGCCNWCQIYRAEKAEAALAESQKKLIIMERRSKERGQKLIDFDDEIERLRGALAIERGEADPLPLEPLDNGWVVVKWHRNECQCEMCGHTHMSCVPEWGPPDALAAKGVGGE